MKTKICTSVEQSKKLIKLGLDPNTADMYYYTVNGDLCKTPNIIESEDDLYIVGFIPAWSLPALLNIIADVNCIWLGTNDAAAWQCELNLGERDHHNTTQYNNPLDAAFEMVCWLKENNEL